MPAFVEMYSSEQREVLFREVIDHGRSAKDVLRAARAGELEGLSSADGATLGRMAYGYALQLVRDERQERTGVAGARKEPEPIARDIAARLLKRALKDADRIARDKPKEPMNTGDALGVLKVTREATALLRDLDGSNGKGNAAKTNGPAAPAQPRGLAAQLAAQPDPAADDAPIPSSDSGEHTTPRTHTPNNNTNSSNSGAVRSRAFTAPRGAVPSSVV